MSIVKCLGIPPVTTIELFRRFPDKALWKLVLLEKVRMEDVITV
jgi:hypothetical protein